MRIECDMDIEFIKLHEHLTNIDNEMVDIKTQTLKLEEAISTMRLYNISESEIDVLVSMVNKNNNRIGYLNDMKNEFSIRLMEMQNTCEHDWEYMGHDSHYDFHKCKKCGKFEKW